MEWRVNNRRKEVIVLASLFGFGIVYNAFVKSLEDKGYHEGYVSYLVVVGTAITVLVSIPLVGFQTALKMFKCFSASGLPMVLGSCWRHVVEGERIKRDALEFGGRGGHTPEGGRSRLAGGRRGNSGVGLGRSGHCR